MVRDFETEWINVDGGLDRFDKLLAMAERESRAALACVRALRLTPQARIEPKTAGRKATGNHRGPMPWDCR
jgi:hypothetical protein